MATWIMHLMIADRILEISPTLDRLSYAVGNIAPDCNVENENWTVFTPSREITHWMNSDRKNAADCERFYSEYLLPRIRSNVSHEEFSFLLGYYSHLVADAMLQQTVRNPSRVHAAWERICAVLSLRPLTEILPESWDSIKKIISRTERARENEYFEDEYISRHPSSAYMTEILPLQSFPDYIDYLPKGSIVRKIGVMGRIPNNPPIPVPMLSFSAEELNEYVETTVQIICRTFSEKNFI